MNIETFKKSLVDFIEKHEGACVYERSCNENEVVFSVYIGNDSFLIKCKQTVSEKPQILR